MSTPIISHEPVPLTTQQSLHVFYIQEDCCISGIKLIKMGVNLDASHLHSQLF